jgi:methyl-accepting chemotaxis protein
MIKSLTQQYRTNEANLGLRKQFMRLTQADIKVLEQLGGWSKQIAAPLAREFYEHQFTFPSTVAFFESQARRKNISMIQLRQHLEERQANYFCEIFQEAVTGGQYGVEYFEKRLSIGKLHNLINLPLKWYLGSYTVYQDLVRKYLRRSFFFRPRFRAKAERAIFVIFNYDIQAITEAFFNDMLESVGVDFETVTIESAAHDVSDYYGSIKSSLHHALAETSHTSQRLAEASEQLAAVADQAGQAASQIAATIQQIGQSTFQQTGSVNQAENSVNQMFQAINQVAAGAQAQAKAVTKSVASTTQMVSMIEQVAASAQNGATEAHSAAQSAQTGAKIVEETIKGMRAIKIKVGLSTQKVQEMGQRSNQIGTIVEAIDDIAGRTNLLALNAAIEAARAGENGKGFAVVADEVRKLAEKSAAAAKEISRLIKDMQSTVSEAVMAMAESGVEVEAGTTRADEAGQALTNILQTVEVVSQQVEEISTAAQLMNSSANELVQTMDVVSQVVDENTMITEEMAQDSGQVAEVMKMIAGASEENSAAVEDVSAGIQEMTAQVEEVAASTQTLSDMAQNLKQLMAQFNLVTAEAESAKPELFKEANPSPSQVENPLASKFLHRVNGF